MKHFIAATLALLAITPAVAGAKSATPPGTCAVVYGPKSIPGDDAHKAMVLHMNIAPGRVANWHSHQGTEYMSVLSGSGWLETQGQPRVALQPGNVYAIAPNALHRAHNGSTTAPLTWTGFLVLDRAANTHTTLKNGAGPWTPGCAKHF